MNIHLPLAMSLVTHRGATFTLAGYNATLTQLVTDLARTTDGYQAGIANSGSCNRLRLAARFSHDQTVTFDISLVDKRHAYTILEMSKTGCFALGFETYKSPLVRCELLAVNAAQLRRMYEYSIAQAGGAV